jgi:hypothetical protein
LFYHGGVRELFHTVRSLVPLSKSKDDPDLFLVNDRSNLLMRSISCAEEFSGDGGTPGAPPPVPPRPAAGAGAAAAAAAAPPAAQKVNNGNSVVSSALSVLTTVGRMARAAAGAFPAAPAPAPVSAPVVAAKPADVERSAEFKTSLGEFQVVEDYAPIKSAEEVAGLAKMMAKPVRSAGVEDETWIAAFDLEGRISEAQKNHLKQLAFSGGIFPTVRREMWKYLLGYYPWDSTFVEREQLRAARSREYFAYKAQWQSITPMQLANFRKFRDRKHMIEKGQERIVCFFFFFFFFFFCVGSCPFNCFSQM